MDVLIILREMELYTDVVILTGAFAVMAAGYGNYFFVLLVLYFFKLYVCSVRLDCSSVKYE